MKKHVIFLMLTAVLLSLISLSACSGGNATSLTFASESVALYLSDGDTYTPQMVIKPKKATYSLAVSNDSMATVNEDGISIKLLRSPCMFTLTATSGELTATQSVMVFTSKATASEEQNVTSGEYYTVVFQAVYGGVEDQIIAPGGYVTKPDMPEEVNGLMLDAWYDANGDGITPYDFSAPVTSNLILVARWVTISSPILMYGNYNSSIYITGMYYAYRPYTEIYFPSVAPEGTKINDTDISGREVIGVYTEAFQGNTSLKTLHFPSSFTEIGKKAFANCSALETVIFEGESLLEVGENAFNNCPALTTCTLPASVTTIGATAFTACSALTASPLPSALTTLGESAYFDCTKLADIGTLPKGLSTLNSSIFENTAIASIDLSNVQIINKRAFYGCTNLSAVTPGNAITQIGFDVFNGTPYLKNAVRSSTDGAVYMGTILLYYEHKSNVFTIDIRPGTTYLAGGSIYNITEDHNFVFSADAPPTLGNYSIEYGSDCINLIVPKASYKAYYDSWQVNRSQLYYQETQSDLLLNVQNTYKSDTLSARSITIIKYTGVASELNIKTILDTAYSDAIGYTKISIATSAFTGQSNSALSSALTKLILPVCTASIKRSAITWLSNLATIEFQGDPADFISPTVASAAIGSISPSFKIYVPSALLTQYQSAFSPYHSSRVNASK